MYFGNVVVLAILVLFSAESFVTASNDEGNTRFWANGLLDGMIKRFTGSSDKEEYDYTRIVGGSAAGDGQFPYQVSLRLNKRHFCGGSILNKRWILTAAHCLAGFNDTAITAVVGTNYLDKGGDSYQSKQTVGHPQYSSLLIRNDIGLIELDKDIAFNDKVKPVKLPTEDFDKADYPAVLSGWGTTSYPGKPPNELQFIKLNVIPQNDCLSTSFRITTKNICTLTKKGEGACHGDSGGPLVADDVQIGVVSWGTPCAKGKPDVFTRVYSYVDWIKKHIDAAEKSR